MHNGGYKELWVFNMTSGKQVRVGYARSAPAWVFPLGIKAGHVFWLSQDLSTVYAFDFQNKTTIAKSTPYQEVFVNGNSASLSFGGIPWTIVISPQEFTFSSAERGEEFSDGDGGVREMFRVKYALDSFMTDDALTALKLPPLVSDDG